MGVRATRPAEQPAAVSSWTEAVAAVSVPWALQLPNMCILGMHPILSSIAHHRYVCHMKGPITIHARNLVIFPDSGADWQVQTAYVLDTPGQSRTIVQGFDA